MNQNIKETVNQLWGMRSLTVDECLEEMSKHPDLKFLITSAGMWFLLRWLMGLWIGAHAIYFVIRIFNLVLH